MSRLFLSTGQRTLFFHKNFYTINFNITRRCFCSEKLDKRLQFFEKLKSNGPLRVGIIGSGPAGFYSAHTLLQEFSELQKKYSLESDEKARIFIDIIERLPIGSGLVRSGVAPDHPEVKNVQNRFQTMINDTKNTNNKLSFLGNINVGSKSLNYTFSITVDEILQCYHALIFVISFNSSQF